MAKKPRFKVVLHLTHGSQNGGVMAFELSDGETLLPGWTINEKQLPYEPWVRPEMKAFLGEHILIYPRGSSSTLMSPDKRLYLVCPLYHVEGQIHLQRYGIFRSLRFIDPVKIDYQSVVLTGDFLSTLQLRKEENDEQ